MGLISYTNLEDGNPAGANDINQRFGDVLAQVNGNLDATNVKKGSLTREVFASDAVLASWPVNSVYLSVDETNPQSTLGGGTWVQIAQGRALVGVSATDTEFDAAEKTSGSKTVSLTAAQNGPHTHSVNPPSATTSSAGNHNHSMTNDKLRTSGSGNNRLAIGGSGQQVQWDKSGTDTDGSHTHTLNIGAFNSSSSGTGAPVNIIQPSFALYVWKRVA